MISWQSIMSVFNTKGTLLKWLQKLEAALKDGVLQSVTVNTISTGVITLSFNFADGSTVTTPQITLPAGEQGPQGIPGTDGADGTDGTNGRDALVQNRALSSANITSPMAIPLDALNRTAVVGEPIVMFATDTTQNKTYMLIGTVTNVGSPGVNPYVFVTYSNKIDITGPQGPQGEPGGITLSQVIAREETLPTATADSPDFVEVGGVLYRKKAVEGDSLLGTWAFNDTINSENTFSFSFSFTCNDILYKGIQLDKGRLGEEMYYIDTNDDMTLVYNVRGTWSGTAYKTIQITDVSALTNREVFETWLKANATKTGGGGGTVTYSYVALADAT